MRKKRTRRHFTKEDLTEENIRKWNETHWPSGICIDLANGSNFVIPHSAIYFDKLKKHPTERDVVYTIRRDSEVRVCCRKWYFPHPKKNPELCWVKGPGLDIPPKDFEYYIHALQELIDWSQSVKGIANYYIREHRYADNAVVRFAMNETDSGSLWLHAQIFRLSKDGSRYQRTKSGVHAPKDNPELFHQFIAALRNENQLLPKLPELIYEA